MSLGNVCALGERLVATCLNNACRHQALITDRGFRRVPDIFEGLRRRMTPCKVLIEATRD
jgi:hypothetical protein